MLRTTILTIALFFSYSCYAEPSFPTIDSSLQKSRDETRLNVLNTELTSEQQQKSQYSASLDAAITNHDSDEKIASLKKSLAEHEENIMSLKKEISGNLASSHHTAPIILEIKQKKTDKEYGIPYWDVYHRKQSGISSDTESKEILK